jgi:hypothetical protein
MWCSRDRLSVALTPWDSSPASGHEDQLVWPLAEKSGLTLEFFAFARNRFSCRGKSGERGESLGNKPLAEHSIFPARGVSFHDRQEISASG